MTRNKKQQTAARTAIQTGNRFTHEMGAQTACHRENITPTKEGFEPAIKMSTLIFFQCTGNSGCFPC